MAIGTSWKINHLVQGRLSKVLPTTPLLSYIAPDLLPTSWHWIPSFGADILLSHIMALFPWWILGLLTLQARFPCFSDIVLHCPSFSKSALLDKSNEIKQTFLPLLPSRSISLPFPSSSSCTWDYTSFGTGLCDTWQRACETCDHPDTHLIAVEVSMLL